MSGSYYGGATGIDIDRVADVAAATGTVDSVERRAAWTGAVTLIGGTMALTYFNATENLLAGTVITYSSTVASVAPTLCRIGLYSVAANGDLTLVGSCANDTALWAVINSRYSKALSAPVQMVARSRYAVGILCVAATPPALLGKVGATSNTAVWAEPPRIVGQIAAADLPGSVLAANVVAAGFLVGARFTA